ncbi:hypothetical protein GH714_039433 [Hevea brasiliensis]|uniref:ribose-phosphate diphosphokinase n=1 Tax=Hevea brasiliensis TaxID=3981 RepID=A0A6A6MJY1_HEVBR|nr:hypothetical protein GH714_039433 [Hevea brasiliensis]
MSNCKKVSEDVMFSLCNRHVLLQMNLMELLIMIDACRRASAKNITAVIPYFGYARADRKTQGRESIAAKLVANLITEAGANRVLACDLHSGQSMARARAFAKKLSDAPLAIVDKRRHGHNVAEVMNLIGDVKGKVAVMVDDMIDTAGTITKGAALLHQEGAREVYACSTHAVFSPPAIERLSSGLFQEVIITNTIPVLEQNYFPQLTILSVANLLGETVWRVHDDCSKSLKVNTFFNHGWVPLNPIPAWALTDQFTSSVIRTTEFACIGDARTYIWSHDDIRAEGSSPCLVDTGTVGLPNALDGTYTLRPEFILVAAADSEEIFFFLILEWWQ